MARMVPLACTVNAYRSAAPVVASVALVVRCHSVSPPAPDAPTSAKYVRATRLSRHRYCVSAGVGGAVLLGMPTAAHESLYVAAGSVMIPWKENTYVHTHAPKLGDYVGE